MRTAYVVVLLCVLLTPSYVTVSFRGLLLFCSKVPDFLGPTPGIKHLDSRLH
jgi:hypothetical protein